MTGADLRLVPAALAAWTVGVVLVGVPSLAAAVAIPCWTIAVAALAGAFAWRERRRLPGIALAAVAAALVATVVAIRGDGVLPDPWARPEPAPSWLGWTEGLRASFRALAAALPGDGAALLTGLAIGDDSTVDPGLDAAMKTASLSHLTAVSGANCAVVVGAVMLGGAAIGIRRRVLVPVAILVLGLFVVLVTPQPSVVRASVMATIALIGLAAGRPPRGIPLLCAAVVLILACDPAASREFGFVLSVLATGGLLVLAGPIARAMTWAMPRRLALALAVPVAAQLAVQPAIVLLDASLPLYGVPANLLAAPAAPIATVLGLLACLTAPVLPPVAFVLAWAAWLPSTWIAGVATTVSTLPGARLPWPGGALGLVLFAGVTVVVALAVLAGGRARRASTIALCLVVAGYGGVLLGGRAVVLVGRPSEWTVAMCSVGQGDAAVLRSAGRVAVIDTGPDPSAMAACLADLGIGRIDLLVLSHFDLDHVGGADALLGRVDAALIGPGDERAEREVVAPLVASGAVVTEVARGDAGELGGHAWRVLWPPGTGAVPEPGNAASVVIRFDGPLSAIFLGDLGAEEQRRMARLGAVGAADVVKVSHHGSADQDAALYRRIAASIALIGVGAGNAYGHPTRTLLAMLSGAAVGRTDTEGLLLVSGDDAGLTLWRERAP